MTRKRPPADSFLKSPPAATSQVSEEELQRRIAAFKARGVFRIAGPDDPIYRGGLQMTSIRSVQTTASQDDEK